MAYCAPGCAIPSLASSPTVGFGSTGAGGLGYGILPYNPAANALAESSGSLGTLDGVIPSCLNQIPSAEMVLQPPSFDIVIPGPILSASCEPTAVGGNTPCVISGSGIVGSKLYGNFLPGNLGLGFRRCRSLLGSRGNICL